MSEVDQKSAVPHLRPPTPERTWGWRRSEVLAAGAQAAVLLGVGVYAFAEGVRRLATPPEVTAGGLLVFSTHGQEAARRAGVALDETGYFFAASSESNESISSPSAYTVYPAFSPVMVSTTSPSSSRISNSR